MNKITKTLRIALLALAVGTSAAYSVVPADARLQPATSPVAEGGTVYRSAPASIVRHAARRCATLDSFGSVRGSCHA
jgi:hypothetical protein